jgi:hypothetical protein
LTCLFAQTALQNRDGVGEVSCVVQGHAHRVDIDGLLGF